MVAFDGTVAFPLKFVIFLFLFLCFEKLVSTYCHNCCILYLLDIHLAIVIFNFFLVMPKSKKKNSDTKMEDSEATAPSMSIYPATLQWLLTAQAESNASVLEHLAKSNADLLD